MNAELVPVEVVDGEVVGECAGWYWQHHGLYVEVGPADSVISFIEYMSDMGDCAFNGIQWPDGTWNAWSSDPYVQAWRRRRDAQEAEQARRRVEEAANQPPPPPPVRIKNPEGRKAWVGGEDFRDWMTPA